MVSLWRAIAIALLLAVSHFATAQIVDQDNDGIPEDQDYDDTDASKGRPDRPENILEDAAFIEECASKIKSLADFREQVASCAQSAPLAPSGSCPQACQIVFREAITNCDTLFDAKLLPSSLVGDCGLIFINELPEPTPPSSPKPSPSLSPASGPSPAVNSPGPAPGPAPSSSPPPPALAPAGNPPPPTATSPPPSSSPPPPTATSPPPSLVPLDSASPPPPTVVVPLDATSSAVAASALPALLAAAGGLAGMMMVV